MLALGMANRTAVYWNDLVADFNATNITNCALSGPGTYAGAVSYRTGATNDPLVDGLVHGASITRAPYFRSAAWFAVSWFGMRLYSAAINSTCTGRVHAQLVVAKSAPDSTGRTATYSVLQYDSLLPEETDISVRAGIASKYDAFEFWPSLDAAGYNISQQLGSKGNSGAPGRWVFRVDGQYVQYGAPYPSFVPADAYQGTGNAPYMQQLGNG